MKFEVANLKLAVAFAAMLAGSAVLAEPAPETAAAEDLKLTVYHDPNCGCCGEWMAHMQDNGFAVESMTQSGINEIKQKLGVPQQVWSCHTALVEGYVVEGHVPADDVKRLVSGKPDVVGIAVPGMPLGSPGMEYGEQRMAFDVVSFDEAGETAVFNHYPAIESQEPAE